MTKKEKIQKRKEKHAQEKIFAERLNVLFAKKYRMSLLYEDTLIKDDGKAYVNVDLTKIESPFSVFSYDKRMNPEIFDYIDNAVFYLRAAIPVVINFDDGGKYSIELKEKIRKCVVRHYSLQYEDKRLEHRQSIIFGIILFFTGILFLVTHFILKSTGNDLFLEITLIMSWMFVWQSCDAFFVTGHSKRVDIYNSGQLALAEILFGEPIH